MRAVAICFDVRVVPPGGKSQTDAVCVDLEHIDGDCVQVFLPYKKRLFGGYIFGDTFASGGERKIFMHPGTG